MTRARFSGSLVALVTPFRDGVVDWEAFGNIIEAQIAAGSTALVPCGSTGEAATLSHEEHAEVIRFTVEHANGRVPVIAGAGSNSTAEAIRLTAGSKRAGASGALLISPYYNRPTQDGIVAHYAEIARQTAFPLLVYNIPARTGSNVLPATLARLAEVDQIVGVKESCGDLNQIAHVIAAVPDSFAVLSGDDWAALPLLALGGKGAISTVSNVAPGEMVELVRAFRAGDIARARAIHFRLLPLLDALFCETNPIPVKAALAMRGLIQEELRLPLVPISNGNRERLQAVLKELGLL